MHHGPVTPQIAQGLLALKRRITAAEIPPSKLDETINLATWNIREFGKKKRTDAAIHYIAEIIGQFDLVGLVEVRDNLDDLSCVIQYLGPSWRCVYSDMIPDAGGNRERIVYLYDRRAVTFNGLAAEASAPRKKDGSEYLSSESFWRAPYMASFRSGNFDFVVLTVHTRWGDSEGKRADELRLLANWIQAKRDEKFREDKDLIVMGDFNIPDTVGPLFQAVTDRGLRLPAALAGLDHGSNLAKDKRYDQILCYPTTQARFTNRGGVVDYFIDDEHIAELFPEGMTRNAFTYQLSDHLPLWVQVDTDIDGERLEQIVRG